MNQESKMIIVDEELDFCPFCGEIGVMFEDLRYRNHPTDIHIVYGVCCSNPDCIMNQKQRTYPYEQAARRAWNTRTFIAKK